MGSALGPPKIARASLGPLRSREPPLFRAVERASRLRHRAALRPISTRAAPVRAAARRGHLERLAERCRCQTVEIWRRRRAASASIARSRWPRPAVAGLCTCRDIAQLSRPCNYRAAPVRAVARPAARGGSGHARQRGDAGVTDACAFGCLPAAPLRPHLVCAGGSRAAPRLLRGRDLRSASATPRSRA